MADPTDKADPTDEDVKDEDVKDERVPDPLGKRALYGALPPDYVDRPDSGAQVHVTAPLPVGKQALYSGVVPERESDSTHRDRASAEGGAFTVRCQRCGQVSHVGLLELLIFQFPIGVWLPRGKFDHRMTCPSCRKRAWCSVTLRRD